jgi:hypothetical protein
MLLNRHPSGEQAKLRAQVQDAGEQVSGGGGPGHLEGGIAAVAHDFPPWRVKTSSPRSVTFIDRRLPVSGLKASN